MTRRYKAKAEWATIGEHTAYFRSKLEQEFATSLEFLKRVGRIRDWQPNKFAFVFPDRTIAPVRYVPDFRVTELDGSVTYWECKGLWRGSDTSKAVLMAKHYPEFPVRYHGTQPPEKCRKRMESARKGGKR